MMEPKLQSTNKKDWAVENDPAVINMGIVLSGPHSENKYIHNIVKHKHLKFVSSSNLPSSFVKLLRV